MPIYEYTCTACGKAFEELVRSAADSVPRCPACRSGQVERRVSVFAARQGEVIRASQPVGGCGRCGDPDGPCLA